MPILVSLLMLFAKTENVIFSGTTVVMALNDYGMAVGADGLAQRYQNSRPGEIQLGPAQGPKAVMCGKVTVCAAAGLIAEQRGKFRFDEWAQQIGRTAAKREGENEVTAVARALHSAAPHAFSSAERDFTEGRSEWTRDRDFVTDILVGGYENGSPHVYMVSVELDRIGKRFRYVEPLELFPGGDPRLPRTLTAGESDEIFKTLIDRPPAQVSKYLGYQKQWAQMSTRVTNTHLRQTAIEVAALIDLEREHVPDKVGRIATLIVMSPQGTSQVLVGLDK